MSADNGIYILETKSLTGDKQYRVKELQNIEYLSHPDDSVQTQIKNAREMFADCKAYNSLAEAEQEANRLLKEIEADYMGICEYGICSIRIKAVF